MFKYFHVHVLPCIGVCGRVKEINMGVEKESERETLRGGICRREREREGQRDRNDKEQIA